jgi:hypothetical protein
LVSIAHLFHILGCRATRGSRISVSKLHGLSTALLVFCALTIIRNGVADWPLKRLYVVIIEQLKVTHSRRSTRRSYNRGKPIRSSPIFTRPGSTNRLVCERPNKGNKAIEREVIESYQIAQSLGFKGDYRAVGALAADSRVRREREDAKTSSVVHGSVKNEVDSLKFANGIAAISFSVSATVERWARCSIHSQLVLLQNLTVHSPAGPALPIQPIRPASRADCCWRSSCARHMRSALADWTGLVTHPRTIKEITPASPK